VRASLPNQSRPIPIATPRGGSPPLGAASLLSFARDGRTVCAIDGDAVELLDTAGDRRDRIAIEAPRAVATFGEQVWIAAGTPLALHRRAPSGRVLGEPVPLPGDGGLVRAGSGTAAIWTALDTPGAQMIELRDELGTLHATALDPCVRLAVPIAPRRAVAVTRSGDLLLPGRAVSLSTSASVVWGAALFDGAVVALVVADDERRWSVLLLSTRDGRLMQRAAIPAGLQIAAAQRRGHLAIRTGSSTVAVVDVRLGQVRIVLEREGLRELAIDDGGERLALLVGDDGHRHIELASTAVAPTVAVSTTVAPAAVAAGETIVAPAPRAPRNEPIPAAAPEPLATRTLTALRPRGDIRPLAHADARAALDRELSVLGARCLVGIAGGWDTRRLGWSGESTHPNELEVAALLGVSRGHARDYVAAARSRLDEAIAALEADPLVRSEAAPRSALIREHGLSPLAAEILLVVAAPSLWGEAARLYAVLAGEPGRAPVDELLVSQVLATTGASRHDIADELDPGAPLVRRGLVRAAGRDRPFAALTVDPAVIARLRRRRERGADDGIAIVGASVGIDDAVAPRAALAAAVAELARPEAAAARLALRGRPGSGRRTILAALAAQAGRRLGVVDVAALPKSPGELAAALRAALRRAAILGLLPCVTGLDAGASADTTAAIRAVLADHDGPVAARLEPECTPPFPAGALVVDLPPLADGDRAALWRRELERHRLSVADVDALAARHRVTAGITCAAAAAVAAGHAMGDPGGDATAALDEQLRRCREARLAGLATRVHRVGSWGDVVLPPDIVDNLRELIGRVRHRQTVFERWGFDDVVTTSRGLTALFDGRPGTGKTLVAGVIARELGLDLYRVDVSKVVSRWLGETEKNLGTVFDAAEDGQCLLLFDEADALFAKRTEVRSSHDRYANLEVNYLLQRLDAFEGIAILTTNFGGSIDQAFQRRLSFRVTFPFPDEEARAELWRVHLPPRLPVAGELDLAGLARRFQLAGGYIRNACLRAAFLAAQEEAVLTHDHLERAIALELRQIGRLSATSAVD